MRIRPAAPPLCYNTRFTERFRAEPDRAGLWSVSQRADLPAILDLRFRRVTPLPQPRGALPARGGGGGESPQNRIHFFWVLWVRSLLHLHRN